LCTFVTVGLDIPVLFRGVKRHTRQPTAAVRTREVHDATSPILHHGWVSISLECFLCSPAAPRTMLGGDDDAAHLSVLLPQPERDISQNFHPLGCVVTAWIHCRTAVCSPLGPGPCSRWRYGTRPSVERARHERGRPGSNDCRTVAS